MEEKAVKKVNSVFDVAKLVLCVVIVAIHTWILPKWLWPLARLAVPVFFMLSAYFFFSKIAKCGGEPDGERKALKGFVKRNLQLYLFWFIALLPMTLKIKGWFGGKNVFIGIIEMVRDIIFGTSFRASWFIMALVIATVIVCYASKLVGNRVLLVLATVVYIAVCLYSSYYGKFENIGIVSSFVERYKLVFTNPYNSYPVALIWVVCGKCFADKTFSLNIKKSVPLLLVSLAFLYAEWYYVRKIGGGYKNDCYLMLLPVSISLFGIICSIKPFSVRGSVTMRKMSTVIYALHATAATALRDYAGLKNNYIVFIVDISLCCAVCAVFFLLERYKPFRWLRYSH